MPTLELLELSDSLSKKVILGGLCENRTMYNLRLLPKKKTTT